MVTTFLTTLGEMLRILLFLGIGYCFNRFRLATKAAEQILSKFVTLLFLPAMMLYTGIKEFRMENLLEYSQMILIGGLFTLLSVLLGLAVAKLFAKEDAYLKGVYRYALAIPNTGAVATPLMLAFFGTKGLFQFGMYSFVLSILTYSWGIMQLLPGEGRHNWLYYLRSIFNLNFIAKLLGIVLGALGAAQWMPAFVVNTAADLSSCYVPVALLLTGFSIADYPFSQILGDRRVWWFTLLRLIVIPMVFLALLLITRPPYMICLMTILAFACPCGMNVVVYPAAYGKDCRSGASMVLISSVLSILTVPLIYAIGSTLCQ